MAKRIITSFGGQLFGSFVAFIITIIAARLYGANDYGKVLYCLTIWSFVAIVTKMGFETSLVSLLGRQTITTGQKKSCIILAFLISYGLCFLTIGAIFISKENLVFLVGNSGVSISLLMIMSISIYFETSLGIFGAIMKGRNDILSYYIGTIIIKNIVCLIALCFFYYSSIDNGVYCISISYLLAYLLSLIYCVFYYIRSDYRSIEYEYYPIKELLVFSLPMLLSGIIATINYNIDSYMAGFYINSKSVAIYNFALRISNFASIGLLAVNNVFSSKIAELYYSKKLKELNELYSYSTKLVLGLNIMILCFVLVFPDDIMSISGKEYTEGAVALCILIFGQLVNAGVGSVGPLNNMTGHGKYALIASISSVITNVLFNILLVNKYGINGIAFASALAIAVANIVNFIYVYRHIHIQPYNPSFMRFIPFIVLTIIMLCVLRSLLRVGFVYRIMISGIVYSIWCAVMGIFLICTVDERRQLKGINKILR